MRANVIGIVLRVTNELDLHTSEAIHAWSMGDVFPFITMLVSFDSGRGSIRTFSLGGHGVGIEGFLSSGLILPEKRFWLGALDTCLLRANLITWHSSKYSSALLVNSVTLNSLLSFCLIS